MRLKKDILGGFLYVPSLTLRREESLIPNISEYAVTFCEGILFVITLEKAGCSKVLRDK